MKIIGYGGAVLLSFSLLSGADEIVNYQADATVQSNSIYSKSSIIKLYSSHLKKFQLQLKQASKKPRALLLKTSARPKPPEEFSYKHLIKAESPEKFDSSIDTSLVQENNRLIEDNDRLREEMTRVLPQIYSLMNILSSELRGGENKATVQQLVPIVKSFQEWKIIERNIVHLVQRREKVIETSSSSVWEDLLDINKELNQELSNSLVHLQGLYKQLRDIQISFKTRQQL